MLAPPVAPILVVSTNLCKRTLITCLARSSRYTEPLNPHNLLKSTSTASPRTTSLPPLEKGEVLSPEIIRATTGGIVTPPTFFKTALSLAPHHVLASLVKGRWIDGKAQALILLLSVYDTSAFLFTKLFCRQDVGIVTPPTFPKPHYPTRIPYCNRLYALICFRIGTIPLAFRRVSVCVCLVGFASLQSLWTHTFKASLPCLLLPLHRILPFPQPLQKGNNPSKIAKCINLNSKPEKCCPINRTIGSLLS